MNEPVDISAIGVIKEKSLTYNHATRTRKIEVCVPASTSNLGAGFDCFGLAVKLYLRVRATIVDEREAACRVRSRGIEGSENLPRDERNLIYRTMQFAAERLNVKLPRVRLAVHNEIPLDAGLGSSSAAIIAGLALCDALTTRSGNVSHISRARILQLGAELEGHADNIAASLDGGWAVTAMNEKGEVFAVKKTFPREIKILVVTPRAKLETAKARAILPADVSRADAIFNLQRTALLCAALDARNYDSIWEAMRDRLHQTRRAPLIPGLQAALDTPRLPGLIGIALSGAGPSIIALVLENFDEIGWAIARGFNQHGIETKTFLFEVDEKGLEVG